MKTYDFFEKIKKKRPGDGRINYFEVVFLINYHILKRFNYKTIEFAKCSTNNNILKKKCVKFSN